MNCRQGGFKIFNCYDNFSLSREASLECDPLLVINSKMKINQVSINNIDLSSEDHDRRLAILVRKFVISQYQVVLRYDLPFGRIPAQNFGIPAKAGLFPLRTCSHAPGHNSRLADLPL